MANQDRLKNVNETYLECLNRSSTTLDPVPSLNVLADLFELEYNEMYRCGHSINNTPLGEGNLPLGLRQMMNAVLRNADFITAVVNYILRGNCEDGGPIYTAACRVLVDLLPGLKINYISNMDDVVVRLFHWAQFADDPLKSYATAVLCSSKFLEVESCTKNMHHLVSLVLNRLNMLLKEERERQLLESAPDNEMGEGKVCISNVFEVNKGLFWIEISKLYSLWPLTSAVKQRHILQYLALVGRYLSMKMILKSNVLGIVFHYLNSSENENKALLFYSLLFLQEMLQNRNFAPLFVKNGGMQKLVKIQPSSTATAVVPQCFLTLLDNKAAFKRICLLPESDLKIIVTYNFALMECSQVHRLQAVFFLYHLFCCKVILQLFDQNDGLKKLIDMIRRYLHMVRADRHTALVSDNLRLEACCACTALNAYFKAHAALKAHELSILHHQNGVHSSIIKSKSEEGKFSNNLDILLKYLPPESDWTPEINIHKLGGINIICQLLLDMYEGRTMIITHVLNVLAVCSVSHRTQQHLCGNVSLRGHRSTPIMSFLVNMLENETQCREFDDEQRKHIFKVVKATLRIIVNCVCGPLERFGSGVVRCHGNCDEIHGEDDLLSCMWHNVRIRNGIVVLLKTMKAETLVNADQLKMLACKALIGLSRSETIRSVIIKCPPLSNGELLSLIKEPKRSKQFREYALSLLQAVMGRQFNVDGTSTLEEILKANAVAQTKIVYHEKELLQLIHDHHKSKEFHEIASLLKTQADISRCSTTPQNHADNLHLHFFNTYNTGGHLGHSDSNKSLVGSQFNKGRHRPVVSALTSSDTTERDAPSTSSEKIKASSLPCPIKFTLDETPVSSTLHENKQSISIEHKELMPCIASLKESQASDYSTLDKIVTEYLRTQHSSCPQPFCTCPTMSLLAPHRCPVPSRKTSASGSITSRLLDRQILPPYGGPRGQIFNRQFINSRCCPLTSFEDPGLTCCAFDYTAGKILLGFSSGNLSVMNRVMNVGDDLKTFCSSFCHSSPITHISTSRMNPDLIFTSASQNSALWRFSRSIPDLMLQYRVNENRACLANQSSDRFIATKEMVAKIYDTETCRVVQTFYDWKKVNHYKYNEATFNPTDDLILNDGNLWDVRSGKMIQKFEKFNQYARSYFHPQGLELVINSEIWDVRTFRLLHRVPALDQCQMVFNSDGSVLYATKTNEDVDVTKIDNSICSIYDALDYTDIYEMPLAHYSVLDLAIDSTDLLLGAVGTTAIEETETDKTRLLVYEMGKEIPESEDEDEDDEYIPDLSYNAPYPETSDLDAPDTDIKHPLAGYLVAPDIDDPDDVLDRDFFRIAHFELYG